MKRYGALLGVLAVGLLVSTLHAQEAKQEEVSPEVLEELFSTGTHAYYAGEYRRAYELLSEAIEGGLADARVFYMRGVVLHALGRPEQGERDFRRGAELEVRQQAEPQDINGFLSRVQGRLRVKLETIRRAERLRVLRRIQAERRARYQAMLRRQQEVSVPEKPGVDPLADQGELPPELASKIKRPQVTLTEVKVPTTAAKTQPEPSPTASPPVAQNNPPSTPSNAPKPKPGTLKATGRVLGKILGGLFRPPANLPQGGVPLPGIGGPNPPGSPPQPAPPQGNNPFDF